MDPYDYITFVYGIRMAEGHDLGKNEIVSHIYGWITMNWDEANEIYEYWLKNDPEQANSVMSLGKTRSFKELQDNPRPRDDKKCRAEIKRRCKIPFEWTGPHPKPE